ncbi:ABC transporter ATP-binding protein [Nocardia africana]|uniref:Aliphatic sulfonates import ATP-binding protein SsuB n=1 Tax=Nocardia africana TaxID=134964 RepID=A0A378X0Q6_9NOCA|nr:ATP-binding cassette domain-containing protein [Nocardia africana]MCC3312527.1 ATP-binding cassette domain-containing protein [Nocardia africana]SUA46153.1 Aliphatic sulfonates import ATP-binding protein SsuB [Nocardia africana]
MTAVDETRTGAPLAVHLSGLRKAFGDTVVLDGVELSIRRGEFVVLLGPSGTGKTTLLRLLTGLEVPDAGDVLVPAVRTTVYQEPRLIPSKRVLANVIVGQRRSKPVREAGLRALAEVGLDGKARQWPATLSGGEAQRAALARALVREPELLLLDEPFAALDALTRLQMQDLVGDLVQRHRPAVLMVTHDVDEAVRLADRILVLNRGRFAVDIDIDLPRPRDRTDPAALRYQAALLAELGVGHTRPSNSPNSRSIS